MAADNSQQLTVVHCSNNPHKLPTYFSASAKAVMKEVGKL